MAHLLFYAYLVITNFYLNEQFVNSALKSGTSAIWGRRKSLKGYKIKDKIFLKNWMKCLTLNATYRGLLLGMGVKIFFSKNVKFNIWGNHTIYTQPYFLEHSLFVWRCEVYNFLDFHSSIMKRNNLSWRLTANCAANRPFVYFGINLMRCVQGVPLQMVQKIHHTQKQWIIFLPYFFK